MTPLFRLAERTAPLAAAIAALVGCDTPAVTAPQGTLVEDSAGVALITNMSPPEAVWQIDEKPFLEIGSVAGDELTLFSFVRQATWLPGGGLAVVDRMSRDIRIFDAAGAPVRRIGRPGDGPGEFGADPFIAVAADYVMAWDQRHFRLSRFDFSGALVEEQTLRSDVLAAGIPIVAEGTAWAVRDDGVLLSTAGTSAAGAPEAGLTTSTRTPTLLYDRSVVRLPEFLSNAAFRLRREDGVGLTFTYRLAGQSSVALGPEPFTVTAYSPDRPTSILYYDREGRLARIAKVNVAQVPVSRTVVAQEIARLQESAVRMRVSSDRVIAAFRDIQLPDSIPPFADHWRSTDDHVVIAHRASAAAEYVRFEVIDPSGVWVASISLSRPLGRVLEFGSDYVITTATDAYDVPVVRVHRLIRTAHQR